MNVPKRQTSLSVMSTPVVLISQAAIVASVNEVTSGTDLLVKVSRLFNT